MNELKTLLFILIYLSVGLSNYSFSQLNSNGFKIDASSAFAEKDEVQMRQQKGDTIYMYSFQKNHNNYLIRFKKFLISENRIIREKKITVGSNDLNFQGFEQVGDKFYMFYSIWNAKIKALSIYSKELDIQKMEIGVTKLLFSSRDEISNYSKTKTPIFELENNFEFIFSKDKKMLLLKVGFKQEKSIKNTVYSVFGTYVFNQNMKRVEAGIVETPYIEKRIDENSLRFYLSNKGKVFFTARIFHSATKSLFLNNIRNYKFEIFSIKDDQINFAKLSVTGTNIRNLHLAFNKGNIYVLSPSGEGRNGEVNKILYKVFDMEFNVLKNAVIPFSEDLISKFENTKKKIKTIEGLKIAEIIFDKEGNLFFIAEEAFYQGSQVLTFFYNDFYYGKIDENANVVFLNKLPKDQNNKYITASNSFTFINDNEKMILFFFDHKNNNDLHEEVKPETYFPNVGGVLRAFVINKKNGASNSRFIFDLNSLAKDSKGKIKLLTNIYTDEILKLENGIAFGASVGSNERVYITVSK